MNIRSMLPFSDSETAPPKESKQNHMETIVEILKTLSEEVQQLNEQVTAIRTSFNDLTEDIVNIKNDLAAQSEKIDELDKDFGDTTKETKELITLRENNEKHNKFMYSMLQSFVERPLAPVPAPILQVPQTATIESNLNIHNMTKKEILDYLRSTFKDNSQRLP